MIFHTLISAEQLDEVVRADAALVVDCRVDLADRARGEHEYAAGHIPGAIFADLDRDLSDLSKAGVGRHPLPDDAAFSRVLGSWGWNPARPVVAYDDANGSLAAARLWWMLRLIGQHNVAVLDGGLAAWKAAGLALDNGPGRHLTRADVDVHFDRRQIVYTDELQAARERIFLLDARAAPRFLGEVEPIDPVAGHVPGAHNRPFSDNLEQGRFKAAEALRREFDALLADTDATAVVHMCGSGVTACHNLLAMEHAGLSGSRVYAPSWSGWIADASRPTAKGRA
jgi:thiosulfate/3-mercaptopyruvate sulfurtransferase